MTECKIEVRPHVCPKCDGKGQYDPWTITWGGTFQSGLGFIGPSNALSNNLFSTEQRKQVKCEPCKGTGIVWSPDNIKLVIQVVEADEE